MYEKIDEWDDSKYVCLTYIETLYVPKTEKEERELLVHLAKYVEKRLSAHWGAMFQTAFLEQKKDGYFFKVETLEALIYVLKWGEKNNPLENINIKMLI